jgi:SOS-response transcriptional repressor LexA
MPDSNVHKIEPRPGLEVFTNQGGLITLKQEDPLGDDDHIVVVHPDDVDRLVEFLYHERDRIRIEAENSDG